MTQRHTPEPGHEDDDDEPPMVTSEASLAADDPTAIWDEEALRKAGLGQVLEHEADSAPATPGEKGPTPSMITDVLEETPPGGTRGIQVPRRQAPQEMSWAATLALALALGAVVYAVIRFLR